MSMEKVATAKRIMTALMLKRNYQLKETITKWKENSLRMNMDEETQSKVEVLKQLVNQMINYRTMKGFKTWKTLTFLHREEKNLAKNQVADFVL